MARFWSIWILIHTQYWSKIKNGYQIDANETLDSQSETGYKAANQRPTKKLTFYF